MGLTQEPSGYFELRVYNALFMGRFARKRIKRARAVSI